MTKNEVARMIFIVKAAYPNFFEKYDNTMISNLLDAWCLVFADKDAKQAEAALKLYLDGDARGYPPSPGQIVDCMHRLKPEELPNEAEAWRLVCKAVRNSNYNSEAEFDKLPTVIKRCVRDPGRLREWAQSEVDTFHTVEQSLFLRTYRAEYEREINNRRIPADMRPKLEMMEREVPLVEVKEHHSKSKTPDEAIEAMIRFLGGEDE